MKKQGANKLKFLSLCVAIMMLIVSFTSCKGKSDVSNSNNANNVSNVSEQETVSQTEENKEKSKLEAVTLVRVVDGDTVVVRRDSGETIKVRLIGIDTPESVNPDTSKNTESGKAASEYVKRELPVNQIYYLEYDKEKEDKYGRTLAYLWYTNDVIEPENDEYVSVFMLNAVLLKKGYATTMKIEPNVKYADMFERIKNNAKENKAELWTAADFSNLQGWN